MASWIVKKQMKYSAANVIVNAISWDITLIIGNPAGLKNDQHRFFAPISCRIRCGISWSSRGQDPAGKLSHIIHDSSLVQQLSRFRDCALTNEYPEILPLTFASSYHRLIESRKFISNVAISNEAQASGPRRQLMDVMRDLGQLSNRCI
jgi:hypothetical protein